MQKVELEQFFLTACVRIHIQSDDVVRSNETQVIKNVLNCFGLFRFSVVIGMAIFNTIYLALLFDLKLRFLPGISS